MTPPLLAFYGDDFTGSADVMEVLQWSGLKTVLFLEPPTREQLLEFDDLRAFGVAGWSRTMSNEEMETELRPALERLRESGASIVHYKTCSTCDSSPQIGSIGKAIEIGRQVFETPRVPVVIAAPNLGRFQVFGNLFARSGVDSEPFRLDRHPTMQAHPITPMNEADLRIHLGGQCDLSIGLIDILQLNDANPIDMPASEALLFDALDSQHMVKIGESIEHLRTTETPLYAVGSSGIEYAITGFWSESGQLDAMRSHPRSRPTFPATEQLLVVTGSCSPVTERQIAYAEKIGFELIEINTARLVDDANADAEVQAVVRSAIKRIEQGANVLLHSSRGPNDERVHATKRAFQGLGYDDADIRLRSGRTLGPKLGGILAGILAECSFQRVAVAGGDTSGYIARTLGITALEAVAPVAPGSPLCKAHANNNVDGTEFFFKGGQVGKDNVWETMLKGTQEKS